VSDRGNQDYFKIAGTRIRLPDIARRARQVLSQERARERHEVRDKGWGPQAVPLNLVPEAYHEHPAREPEPVAPAAGSSSPAGSAGTEAAPATRRPRPSMLELATNGIRTAMGLGLWVARAAGRALGRSARRRFERLVERGVEGRDRGLAKPHPG
jgi:hypothetical protein